jgi:hypothetical protein
MSEGVEIALDVEAIRRKGPESYNTLTTTDKLHYLPITVYEFVHMTSISLNQMPSIAGKVEPLELRYSTIVPFSWFWNDVR